MVSTLGRYTWLGEGGGRLWFGVIGYERLLGVGNVVRVVFVWLTGMVKGVAR